MSHRKALDDCDEEASYSAEAMEEERQRCYELGVAAERERWAPLLRAAGRVLQAADDGYLQPAPETLQGGLAVDELREAWRAFAPARIRGA